MNILAAQGHSTAATKIDHIICLNNNTEVPHSYKNYNLNCLKRILPLYGCDYQYNSYYYYDNILSKIGTFTLMPYMIITSQYVCLLTSDMQRGALFSEPEFISMFEKIFDEYLIVSSPLLRRLDSAFTQLDYVCDSSPAIKEKYSFQMTPCLTFFLTPGFIEKYIKQDFPERPLFIQKLLKYIENFTHSQFLHSTSFIFSLKGIQHFLSTGRINEYPYEVYDAFDMKDRIYLVKQLLHACKTLDFKMLKNNIGDIRNELFLYVTQQNGYLMFSVPPHQNLVYLDIKEPGLLFTFFDFCKNLEPDLFYTPEETIELITMEIESAKLSQIP